MDFEDEVLVEDGYRSSDEEEEGGSPGSGAGNEEEDEDGESLAVSEEGEEGKRLVQACC